MPIRPDTKDWTWVLQRRCPQCGFEAGQVDVPELPALIAANAAGWALVLARRDVRVRPDDDTWSPLEYAAHVRDVARLFAARLAMLLGQDDPEFPSWDQDAAAQHYAQLEPGTVGQELQEGRAAAAAAFAEVAPQQYGRIGRRGDGSEFTVLTLGQYLAHELVHHLWDVTHV
jgi:hypothetical protein